MGHAGAIIADGEGTATEKIKILEDSGIYVLKSLDQIGERMLKIISKS